MKTDIPKKEKKRRIKPYHLLTLLGICLLLYPVLASLYKKQVTKTEVIRTEHVIEDRYQDENFRQAVDSYQKMLERGGFNSVQTLSSTLDALKDGEPVARIEIPAIQVNLPVYYGVTDRSLRKATAILENTSMPYGGPGTHCVITGHRGTYDADIFLFLDQLKINDYIYLFNGKDTPLVYRVQEQLVVKPEETDQLKIVPGEDLLTLITCTPKLINTHRILLTAARDPAKEQAVAGLIEAEKGNAQAEHPKQDKGQKAEPGRAAQAEAGSLPAEIYQEIEPQNPLERWWFFWQRSNKYNLLVPLVLVLAAAIWLFRRQRRKKNHKGAESEQKNSDKNPQ